MNPQRLVCFAHGKESGPWGTKITRLAEVARARGFDVMSPDYSHSHDPKERVAHLLQLAPRAERLVLVGSSMGGYVSAMACAALRPQGLFLIAPALYFPGWDEEPADCPALTTVVHGWADDVVPVERGIAFARRNRAALHLLDSGHTLNDQLPALALLFEDLLNRVLSS
jgi:alpha/beta superfamily hydrolase